MAAFATLVCQRNCGFSLQRHKTAKSCAFCDCTPEFYGGILYWLLEKQGKLYFLQSSQTKGRDVLASKKPSLVQTPCAKTAKSCAFCDSLPVFAFAAFATLVCLRNCVFLCKGTKLKIVMPVFALECFSAFDTGGLWLWLGAFEKSRLYRCQSTPGPPMPVFCGTELSAVHRAFRCAQSFLPCTELFPVHRHRALGARACHPDQRFGTETALPCANALCQNCKKLCFLRLYAGVLWRNLVFAFGKARQTLLFAK